MLAPFVLTDCSDRDLLAGLKRLVTQDCDTTAQIVAHLAEIDLRRLYVEEGCSSLFKYCVEVLHLSESAAYRRIDVARLARRFPLVFEKLANGSVNLSTAQLLGPSLTEENHAALLDAATHKSKEEVERLVAELRPSPDVPTVLRKLPGRLEQALSRVPEASFFVGSQGESAGGVDPASPVDAAIESSLAPPEGRHPSRNTPAEPVTSQKSILAPLAPDRYKIQFTADAETYRMLRQLQELLRHQIPNGDPAEIFSAALRLLHKQVTREKLAQVKRPREKTSSGSPNDHGAQVPGGAASDNEEMRTSKRNGSKSRHVPSHVRREVWFRDDGQCAYVSLNGRRCSERGGLEFHHVEPFAWGGRATVDNIALRCRTHNAHEGEVIFGYVRRRARDKSTGEGTLSGESSAVPTLASDGNSVWRE